MATTMESCEAGEVVFLRAALYNCCADFEQQNGQQNRRIGRACEFPQLNELVGGNEPAGEFRDRESYRSTPFLDRPGGLAAYLSLFGGGVLVVRPVGAAFASGGDFLAVATELARHEITLAAPDLGLSLNPRSSGQALCVVAAFLDAEKGKRARALARTWETRRARGRVSSNTAPPGYQLAGRKRRKRLVRDARQDGAIREAERMAGEGLGAWSICRRLCDAGHVHPVTDQPWTIGQVRRVVREFHDRPQVRWGTMLARPLLP